jgi:uncharacterized protein
MTMRWEGGEQSSNVEDRRGMKPVAAAGGIGGLVLMAVVYFLTGDARIAQQAGQVVQQRQAQPQQGPAEPINDRTYQFARTVLRYTEVVWTDQFRKMGKRYEEPKLVLFNERVQSGCGVAPSSVGPFYCPADHKLYYDPSFFDELEQKLGGSKAEFSQAYVIAHEVGHHVQNLLWYNRKVDEFEGREGTNAGVRLELQADYLAGVWAHYGQEKYKFIESGDVESAIKSANAIGDDRLQKRSGGWVSPEKFSHGSAEARVRWFKEGFQTGNVAQLDRFFTAPLGELDTLLRSPGRTRR